MKKQEGLTLLEVMLVIVISTALVVLSIQQYLSYRRDADVTALKANVDTLFQSLANYFRAHCASDTNFNQLNPSGSISVTMNSLRSGGFLSDTIPLNPLVESSGGGYILQFNQVKISGNKLPQRDQEVSNASGGGTKSVGNIVIWRAQVAVNLNAIYRNATNAVVMKNLLGADCLSTTGGGGTVRPCATAPANSTDYVVWERIPSFSNTGGTSPLWTSMPMVKQFNQMYRTESIMLLLETPSDRWAPAQYYVCGS